MTLHNFTFIYEAALPTINKISYHETTLNWDQEDIGSIKFNAAQIITPQLLECHFKICFFELLSLLLPIAL